MLISDVNGLIICADVNWPGSVHDSRAWKNNPLYHEMMNCDRYGILLGDSGYAITPFLITPFNDPVVGSPEKKYNTPHNRGRSVIERTNGQLKRRFHCLGSCLRIKIERIPSTIYACCLLHNKAKLMKDSDEDLLDPPFIHDDNFRDENLVDRSENYLRLKGHEKKRAGQLHE